MHPALSGGLKGALSGFLGESGVPHDDASYDGADPNDALSMSYYRDKATQFQAVMNSLDVAAAAAQDMIAVAMTGEVAFGDSTADELIADLSSMLSDFYDRRSQFRMTAEAINAGAVTINAVGGRFPVLSVPSGLGLAPIVMGGAAIAAVAVAASLIVWGNTWLRGVNQRMQVAASAALIEDPDRKAAFLTAAATASAAADAAEESPLSSIAGVAKWVAIGAVAFMVWKAVGED